jgi:peroxiredoxin
MPIKVGDRLPSTKFRVMTAEGPAWKTTDEIFKGKKVALFAVPGAFTGVCHKQHMPTVVANVDALKAKGVATIAVTGVNDISVMDAWKKASNADHVEFLADGNRRSSPRQSTDLDLNRCRHGHAPKRYSMLVDDGVVTKLNVESRQVRGLRWRRCSSRCERNV